MTEIRSVRAMRVKPGDRWSFVYPDLGDKLEEEIYESLTTMLQAIFERTGHTNFYIDSKAGTISSIDWEDATEPDQTPDKKWSLYGEY